MINKVTINWRKNMELHNLKVNIDGKEFELPGVAVIAGKVIGLATRTDKDQEGIESFVIQEGQQKLLIEVDKENIQPCMSSNAKELELGHFVIVMGQVSDTGLILNKDVDCMQTIKAENVRYMEMDEAIEGLTEIIK